MRDTVDKRKRRLDENRRNRLRRTAKFSGNRTKEGVGRFRRRKGYA